MVVEPIWKKVPAKYNQFLDMTPTEICELIKALHWMLDSCPGDLESYTMQPIQEDCVMCQAPNQVDSCRYIHRHGGVTTLRCPKVFGEEIFK